MYFLLSIDFYNLLTLSSPINTLQYTQTLYAVYGLKWNILVRLVLKFLQTFKGSFRAQTMPKTRSKQLVGAQEFPMGVIHASSKSRFLHTNTKCTYIHVL